MNKILLSFFCYIAVTFPAFAALQPGDAAPNFQVRASLAGEEFDYSLENALSQGPVVVYFYPSAFTRGCTSLRSICKNLLLREQV